MSLCTSVVAGVCTFHHRFRSVLPLVSFIAPVPHPLHQLLPLFWVVPDVFEASSILVAVEELYCAIVARVGFDG